MKYSILIIALIFSGLSMARNYNDNIAYGKVIDVRPVYERVSVPERQRVCERPRYREKRANTGGAILGGIIGGVLGSQIGSGSGRDAATAVGVIAGASVGANHPSHRKHRSRCYTDVRYRQDRQLSGRSQCQPLHVLPQTRTFTRVRGPDDLDHALHDARRSDARRRVPPSVFLHSVPCAAGRYVGADREYLHGHV